MEVLLRRMNAIANVVLEPTMQHTDLYAWALVLITFVQTVIFSITIKLPWDAISIGTLEVCVGLALSTRLTRVESKVIYSNMCLRRRKYA